MTPEFLKAFSRCIDIEGGYVNDPSDPGGETKFGISKRSYPDLDIKNLTLEQAREIYCDDYWAAIPGIITGPLRFHVFDFAVNSSLTTAIRHLQKAVGVADDGYVGPVTSDALASFVMRFGIIGLIASYSAFRLEYMTKLKNWPNASRGWTRRVCGNLLSEFSGE